MGDMTAEYFARVSFIKAVEWLEKFEKIPIEVKMLKLEQRLKTKEMKANFEKITINLI